MNGAIKSCKEKIEGYRGLIKRLKRQLVDYEKRVKELEEGKEL